MLHEDIPAEKIDHLLVRDEDGALELLADLAALSSDRLF